MPTIAQEPYSEFYINKVFHKGEQRYMAMLYRPKSKERHTMSYARYLMATTLGRKLDKHEQVDHINNDKTDDRIENLQILSFIENARKAAAFYHPHDKYADFVCPICSQIFKIAKRNIPFKPVDPCCSRKCAGIKLSNKCKANKQKALA